MDEIISGKLVAWREERGLRAEPEELWNLDGV